MSAEKMPQLLAVGESHKGCVRAHNEDNFFCISMYPGYCFAGVADGVGGHSCGDQASYLCCHRLILDWKEFFKRTPELNEALIASFLMESVKRANNDITGINRAQKKTHNSMCTTLAAAVFTPSMVIVIHVGDSRLYCCRNSECRLLTIDHTVQNELAENPRIKAKAKAGKLTQKEKDKLIAELTIKMKECAKRLDFEQAVYYRDKIKSLSEQK